MDLENEVIFVQSGSFMAGTIDIDINTKWGGSKTFFSKEGLFLLKIEGTGSLFTSSFGAIHPLTLEEGETYIVDTGHIVAFDEHDYLLHVKFCLFLNLKLIYHYFFANSEL